MENRTQIDEFSDSSLQEGPEGCLSIPGISSNVIRYDKIKVTYNDMKGGKVTREFTKFPSRLFQHELDHLNGKLMLTKILEGTVEDYALLENFTIMQQKKYANLLKTFLDLHANI